MKTIRTFAIKVVDNETGEESTEYVNAYHNNDALARLRKSMGPNAGVTLTVLGIF